MPQRHGPGQPRLQDALRRRRSSTTRGHRERGRSSSSSSSTSTPTKTIGSPKPTPKLPTPWTATTTTCLWWDHPHAPTRPTILFHHRYRRQTRPRLPRRLNHLSRYGPRQRRPHRPTRPSRTGPNPRREQDRRSHPTLNRTAPDGSDDDDRRYRPTAPATTAATTSPATAAAGPARGRTHGADHANTAETRFDHDDGPPAGANNVPPEATETGAGPHPGLLEHALGAHGRSTGTLRADARAGGYHDNQQAPTSAVAYGTATGTATPTPSGDADLPAATSTTATPVPPPPPCHARTPDRTGGDDYLNDGYRLPGGSDGRSSGGRKRRTKPADINAAKRCSTTKIRTDRRTPRYSMRSRR